MFWFSKLAGHVISLRSGVIDLLSFCCGLKLAVLYEKEYWEVTWHSRFNGDKKQFCANTEEFIVSQSFNSEIAKTVVESLTD